MLGFPGLFCNNVRSIFQTELNSEFRTSSIVLRYQQLPAQLACCSCQTICRKIRVNGDVCSHQQKNHVTSNYWGRCRDYLEKDLYSSCRSDTKEIPDKHMHAHLIRPKIWLSLRSCTQVERVSSILKPTFTILYADSFRHSSSE